MRRSQSRRFLMKASLTRASSFMANVLQKVAALDSEQIPAAFRSRSDWSDSGSTLQPPKCYAQVSIKVLMTLSFTLVSAMSSGSMWIVMEVSLTSIVDSDIVEKARWSGAIVFCASVLLGTLLGGLLSILVTHSMASVRCLVKGLTSGKLRMTGPDTISKNWHDVFGSFSSSRIRDVADLQAALRHIWTCVSTFSCYLPDSVVQTIMSGDPRARRLHVERRHVTVMFSDLQGFTTISESLEPEDLLFLLTRYLSVMTKVAAHYGGLVTEILGDGLLVYWNALEDDPKHAAKACAAAISMMQMLQIVNKDFISLGLPELHVRIGLNTGSVFVGNLGSESKMKFGCLGDPVNLASRLEGLCKCYGVGTLCSSAIRSEVQRMKLDFLDFVFREIDEVRVKGKLHPTVVFELLGMCRGSLADLQDSNAQDAVTTSMSMAKVHPLCNVTNKPFTDQESCTSSSTAFDISEIIPIGSEALIRAQRFDEALQFFRQMRFTCAEAVAKSLLDEFPDDRAAARLLCRIRSAIEGGDNVRDCWSSVTVMEMKGGDNDDDPLAFEAACRGEKKGLNSCQTLHIL